MTGDNSARWNWTKTTAITTVLASCGHQPHRHHHHHQHRRFVLIAHLCYLSIVFLPLSTLCVCCVSLLPLIRSMFDLCRCKRCELNATHIPNTPSSLPTSSHSRSLPFSLSLLSNYLSTQVSFCSCQQEKSTNIFTLVQQNTHTHTHTRSDRHRMNRTFLISPPRPPTCTGSPWHDNVVANVADALRSLPNHIIGRLVKSEQRNQTINNNNNNNNSSSSKMSQPARLRQWEISTPTIDTKMGTQFRSQRQSSASKVETTFSATTTTTSSSSSQFIIQMALISSILFSLIVIGTAIPFGKSLLTC